MELASDSYQLQHVPNFISSNASQSSLIAKYETIAKSLQPYATRNPKSLTYFIRLISHTAQRPQSSTVFTWIARDDHLGYHKKFDCTSYSQVIERYYEACVFIDMRCTPQKNLYLQNINPSNNIFGSSHIEINLPFTGLAESIPDYLLGDSHLDIEIVSKADGFDNVNQIHGVYTASTSLSPVNVEYETTPLEIKSTLIDSKFTVVNEVKDPVLSDTATIYSDDTWDEEWDELVNSSGKVTKREVINYLYPKYVYSYSTHISYDDTPTGYCKKPVLVDDSGSWHYECPKGDPFQNQLVNEIREWNIFKEERKAVMIKKSLLYPNRHTVLENTPQNTVTNVKNVVDGFINMKTNKNEVQCRKKPRRRRNQLMVCEIKCDGRESSGNYVLRKKNLIGISALEAFDNNWAYEKILRDIKKQSKHDKIKTSDPLGSEDKVKRRIGRPPKVDKFKSQERESDRTFPTKVRRGRIPKSVSYSHVSTSITTNKLDGPKPALDHRNKKIKQPHDHSESITGETPTSHSTFNNYTIGEVTSIFAYGNDNSTSNDIKSFGTRSPIFINEATNHHVPIIGTNASIKVSVNNDQSHLSAISGFPMKNCDNEYFDYENYEGGVSENDIVGTGKMLQTLFKRTHRSRKPPSFYDCYIPLDINE